jgi:pimeloyl-ACP methyl ester carboxylesterase
VATAQLRGFELDYDTRGGGELPPLVWGHGLTSSRGISAAYPLVDLAPVAANRQVITYDARGHGLSSMMDDPTTGSWAELALDQLALLDHLGIDRVVLGGVSMGAGTALHSALALGDRLDRLVLVIPPTGWEERAPQVAVYEQLAQIVEAKGPKGVLAAAKSAGVAPPDPFVGSTEYEDRRAGNYGGADPARMAACLRGAAYADLPAIDELQAIVAPTLVLAWSGDPGHPVSTAERLGQTLPNVEVSVASTRSQFDEWSARVDAFLR